MVSEGKGLDRNTINDIVKTKLTGPNSMYSLKHMFKSLTVFCRSYFVLGNLLGKEFGNFYDHMETHEVRFLSFFKGDNQFGSRVAYATNQNLQTLFHLCAQHNIPSDFGKAAYSFNDIIQDILRYRFYCNLPSSLLEKRLIKNKRVVDLGNYYTDRENTFQEKKKKVDGNYVKNENINPRWKLNANEDMKKIFNQAVLYERPKFNDTCCLCHRWALRGYCFFNCYNKALHCKLSNS